MKGEVPDEEYTIPIGLADVKREGEDATIIAVGPMVEKSLQAAVALEDEGWDVEVVDPRSLSPLDTATLCKSVRKTGRAVICGEDSAFAGAVSEISAMVSEQCFGDLKAPVVRVGSPHVPMPFSAELVKHVVPDADNVVAAVRQVMG